MAPHLVCQITTDKASGGQRRGSGYPITPNRIITAAHVIEDAALVEGTDPAANVRHINVAFGANGERVEGPVVIEWSGAEDGVDVAVLRCELKAKWQPGHELLTESPNTVIQWWARGYTEYGKAARADGKDAYHGELVPFTDDESTVELGCVDGLVAYEQWAGGSGSVAFESAEPTKAVAVITDYRDGKKQDQLVAVPLSYLLKSEATRTGFRKAIQFDLYQQRNSHRNDVIEAVASKLESLQEEHLKQIAGEMMLLVGEKTSGIDLNSTNQAALAKQTSSCIIRHTAITRVVGCLVGLMREMSRGDSGRIADIIDLVLPLNYAPEVIRQLHEKVASNELRLVENEVFSRTLAEIIMAGYDQKSAEFAPSATSRLGVKGGPAIDNIALDGPEVGQNLPGTGQASLLKAVSDLLYELLEKKGEVLARIIHKPAT